MKWYTALVIVAIVVLLVAAIMPAHALKVYSNPSVQTGNVSPDGTYNEGNSMQVVSDKFNAKCAARGFATRDSNWLSLSAACSDAVSWGANAFVSEHTDAAGSGWTSGHGTHGLYYQSSSGWYDPNDRDLCVKAVDNCVNRFSTAGRGAYAYGGYNGDWSFYGTYNLYVLSNTPNMNAILVEGLFHTNYDDTQLLKTDNGKNLYAEGLYRGVCQHYGYTFGTYDLVMDNSASGFSASANWATYSSSTDKYGANYRGRSTAAVSDVATWTINVPQAGNYDVYAWWPQGANRPTAAPYLINYNGGQANVKVNQQINGGKWNLLGRWNFNAGNNTIQLSCWTTAGYTIIADAVRMVGPQ